MQDRHQSIAHADAIEQFWKWFSKNESRLRAFESDPDKYLMELLEQSRKIKRGLAIELEPPKNGIINMTVSADGNVELFALVTEVVSRSPAIKGWKFIAFRQRMPSSVVKEMNMKVGPLLLEPSKMKFLPVVEHGKLNVIIYADGVTAENYEQIAYAGLILLDSVLGEYDAATKVEAFDFRTLPEKGREGPVPQPFLELAKFVDDFHKNKR
ncbi:hypothetical protein LZZ85_07075 [Terrimonas sp. NA20]|uniref:Uncharacterized protein n=1 Tax=Terrimonas ginsenosidimutans TaxID=2908004 RepID=A0ABS9KP09_9BACT|nr:hypothetical protein [Terrimonas ginsenosidimutans]MCG2614036.1 hypothetical protein [Terrimonas ginsenosidimutans]